MRKSVKKMLAVAAAAVMTVGTLSLAACGVNFKHVENLPKDLTVDSNGGFVVSVGEYYYFINGYETYSADNTYGKPVKGSLMRILKDDVKNGTTVDAEGNPKSEIVVPSLMVAGDTTAGIFVYGDRVYYATPTTVRDTKGNVQNTYLDFKSAKLDGTDIKEYVRLESNTTVYRYVKDGDNVYLVYVESSTTFTIHSFNTANNTDTVLVKNATSYRFNESDKTDPTVYYTMGVTERADSKKFADPKRYNQIYRVSAKATEVPAGYKYGEKDFWDEEYLKENDGEAPYLNLGEIVLDGVGSDDLSDVYNHSTTTPRSPVGYSYTLNSYANGGLYFVRNQTASTSGTVGSDGTLYFLDLEDVKSGWDTIGANDKLGAFDVIATDASSTTVSSPYFYREGGTHHYLYSNGTDILRADVIDTTDYNSDTMQRIETEMLTIAYGVSSPVFIGIDNTSHHVENPTAENPSLHYVYYANSLSSGYSVERAVYNGEEDNYKKLEYPDENNKNYLATRVLDVQHVSGWYNYELLDNTLFFADAKTYGSNTFNYINTVRLEKGNKLMNNVQLQELNEKYDEIVNIVSNKKDGLLLEISSKVNARLSTAIEYYFWTGEDRLFYENQQDARDADLDEDELPFEAQEIEAFEAFVKGEGFTFNKKDLFKKGDFVDENNVSYRTRDYFVKSIGFRSDEDNEKFDSYWKLTLAHYTAPEVVPFVMPGWATALIVVGAIYVVYAIVVFVVYSRKVKKEEKKAEKKAAKAKLMHVDTTDDKEIDVYATDEEPTPETELTEEPAQQPAEEPAEATEEPADDTPQE